MFRSPVRYLGLSLFLLPLAALAHPHPTDTLQQAAHTAEQSALPAPYRFLPVPATESYAEAEVAEAREEAVQISGFFDAVGQTSLSGNPSDSHVALHQVELGLARELNPRTATALALSYVDAEFGIGSATISYVLRQAGGSASPKRDDVEWSVTGGQFDVPFGLDYLVYSSISRPLVTQPLVVAEAHGGWNDLGVMTALCSKAGSLELYAVRGFELWQWTGEDPEPEELDEEDARWATVQPDASGGVRAHHALGSGFEGGFSLAAGWTGRARAFRLGGVHLQRDQGGLAFKGEALWAVKAESLAPQSLRGGYLEALERRGRLFLIQRVEYLEMGSDVQRGLSLGGGAELAPGLECRAEWCCEPVSESRQRLLVQIIAGF